MTVDYLKERARRGSLQKFKAILANVPDVEPEERDRLQISLAIGRNDLPGSLSINSQKRPTPARCAPPGAAPQEPWTRSRATT